MLFMMQRFLRIQTSVKHALIDLKKDALYPTQGEISMLEEIVAGLEIVEGATRQLCRRDISLAETDQVPNVHVVVQK